MKACEFNIEDGVARIVLGTSLDLSVADDLRNSMLEILTAVNNVEIDASGVERIGAASIQILLSSFSAVKDTGGQFKATGISEVFEKGFGDLGLGPDLNEWR